MSDSHLHDDELEHELKRFYAAQFRQPPTAARRWARLVHQLDDGAPDEEADEFMTTVPVWLLERTRMTEKPEPGPGRARRDQRRGQWLALVAVVAIVAMAGAIFGLYRPNSHNQPSVHHPPVSRSCPSTPHPSRTGALYRLPPVRSSTGYQYVPDPYAIVCGPDGNLWVTTFGAIYRLTPGGAFTQINLPAGVLGETLGITAGPDGNVWFTMSPSRGAPLDIVGRISPTGQVTVFPLPWPTKVLVAMANITAGPDGNLWFGGNIYPPNASPANSPSIATFIGRITPEGKITVFRMPTSQDGPFDLTAGPDGNVWFTNSGGLNKDPAVGRITPRGAITEYWLSNLNSWTSGITLGPDGNLWFTVVTSFTGPDTNDTTVQIGRMTPQGKMTIFPPVPGHFYSSDSIVRGPDGNLWFNLEDFNYPGPGASVSFPVSIPGIGRITPKGVVTVRTDLLGGKYCDPVAIASGPDGNLWIAEQQSPHISTPLPGGGKTFGGGQIERYPVT